MQNSSAFFGGVSNSYILGGDYRHSFQGQEKDDEVKGDGNSLDFGARIYDSRVGRFLSIDRFTNKYPNFTPYSFAGNTPINAKDIDGDSLYILVYVSGNSHGDEMFEGAALTRQYDIEHSSTFDPTRDEVVIFTVTDLSDIEARVELAVEVYSPIYGQTAEFGVYSHAGFDGPTGSVPTSENALSPGSKQMSPVGWGNIDFNFAPGARAGFFGCNTGASLGTFNAFNHNMSSLPNFKDVFVWGQRSTASASLYVDVRATNPRMAVGNHVPVEHKVAQPGGGFVTVTTKTYMVSVNRGEGSDALFGTAEAKKMTVYKNGTYVGYSYQQGDTALPQAGSGGSFTGKAATATPK